MHPARLRYGKRGENTGETGKGEACGGTSNRTRPSSTT